MNRPDIPDCEFRDDELVWSRPVEGVVFGLAGGGGSPHLPRQACGPAPLVLNIALPPAALAGADALRLDLSNLSPAACLAGVTLRCGARERGAAGGVYFSGALEPLAAGAGRAVLFPADSMGLEGEPGGWADASALEVTLALPKGDSFRGELCLALKGMHCLARRTPEGPRLGESGLARVLGPGEDRREARSRRSHQRAATCSPWIEPPLPAPLERPEDILNGTIMGRRTGFPPQWTGGPERPHQWLHLLHRHHFLRPLAREFARTRDPGLARAMARAMTDWIKRHPVPLGSGGGAGAAWETLSTAWRLREWLTVLAATRPGGAWEPGMESLVLRSVWEHARHLMDHRGHPTNWALVEAAALALAGLELPAFREAPLWAQTGLERLIREAERQFMADGVHFELSPLYQAVCLEALLAVRRAALNQGRSFPPGLERTLRRGLAYLRALERPEGTWPALNDSWGIDGDHRPLLALARRELGSIGRSGGKGRRPTGPAPSGGLFPKGGVCVLGDPPSAAGGNRLVLRSGPAGAAHAHGDNLSLDVCLAGRAFLADPGISGYDPGPVGGRYRLAEAHSMPWVEGWERRADRLPWPERIAQAPGDLVRAGRGRLEAATAVAWGPWPRPEDECLIFRTVVCILGGYFVVRDHFAGRGLRRIRVGWQFAPGAVDLEPRGRSACLRDPQGPVGRLDLLWAGAGPEAGLRRTGGWAALAGKDVPAAHLACSLKAELPLTLVWLLRPEMGEGTEPRIVPGEAPGGFCLGVPLPGGAWDALELGPPGLARRAPGHLSQGLVTLTRHRPGRAAMRRRLAE